MLNSTLSYLAQTTPGIQFSPENKSCLTQWVKIEILLNLILTVIRPILAQFSPNNLWKSMNEQDFNSDQGMELLRLPFFVYMSVKNGGGDEPRWALLGLRVNLNRFKSGLNRPYYYQVWVLNFILIHSLNWILAPSYLSRNCLV